MAIYGNFNRISGKTRNEIILKIIFNNLNTFFSGKNVYIFSNQTNNFVYVDDYSGDKIEYMFTKTIKNEILEEYSKKVGGLSGTGNQINSKKAAINAISRIFYKIFTQTYYISESRILSKSFLKEGPSGLEWEAGEIIVEKGKDVKFNNEDNEMHNCFMFDYKRKYENKFSFVGYMFLAYSKQFNYVKLPKIYVKRIQGKDIKNSPIYEWNLFKFLKIVLEPDPKWYRSSELTAEAMKKSGIFDNNDYIFYSESSKTYKDIFDTLSIEIASSKIFDTYFRALNINKYFISDILAIKNENDLKQLEELIGEFKTKNNIQNLRRIFTEMDNLFIEKKFIPISLKRIEDYSTEKIPDDFVTKKEIKSGGIKILNKPSRMKTDISLDDFDLLLLDILLKIKNKTGNIKDILNENIKIKYETFKYSSFINFTTYGKSFFGARSPHSLYFDFDVVIAGKNKTYMFEVDSKSIKIRRKGTASASGEGTIRPETINYVLKQVYNNSNYNNQLTKIANNRMRNRGQGINYKNLSSEYKNFMSKKRIITPNDTDTLEKIISQNPANEEHYKNYYKFLTNGTYKNIYYSASNICGKELGQLLNANVELHGEHVKVILEEYKKKQFISSMWGLVSARGPIQFLDKTFTTATGLEDIAKYQIKFPALVKIGI